MSIRLCARETHNTDSSQLLTLDSVLRYPINKPSFISHYGSMNNSYIHIHPHRIRIPYPRVLLQHTQNTRLDMASELLNTKPGLDVVAMRIHADDAD